MREAAAMLWTRMAEHLLAGGRLALAPASAVSVNLRRGASPAFVPNVDSG